MPPATLDSHPQFWSNFGLNLFTPRKPKIQPKTKFFLKTKSSGLSNNRFSSPRKALLKILIRLILKKSIFCAQNGPKLTSGTGTKGQHQFSHNLHTIGPSIYKLSTNFNLWLSSVVNFTQKKPLIFEGLRLNLTNFGVFLVINLVNKVGLLKNFDYKWSY